MANLGKDFGKCQVPPESIAQVAGAAAAGEVLLGRLLARVQLLLQAAAAVPGDGVGSSFLEVSTENII